MKVFVGVGGGFPEDTQMDIKGTITEQVPGTQSQYLLLKEAETSVVLKKNILICCLSL